MNCPIPQECEPDSNRVLAANPIYSCGKLEGGRFRFLYGTAEIS